MADVAPAAPAATGPDQAGGNVKRLDFKKQSLDDAYAAPANLLEIEVTNAETHGFARNRYTDYEVRMRVSLPRKSQLTLLSLVGQYRLIFSGVG